VSCCNGRPAFHEISQVPVIDNLHPLTGVNPIISQTTGLPPFDDLPPCTENVSQTIVLPSITNQACDIVAAAAHHHDHIKLKHRRLSDNQRDHTKSQSKRRRLSDEVHTRGYNGPSPSMAAGPSSSFPPSCSMSAQVSQAKRDAKSGRKKIRLQLDWI
jgi:hypothetical protein